MSLSPIAPWIVPPDYTGAMARGAQLGLSARAQDEKAASDALEKSRLQLAYEHLLEREKSSDALANKKFGFEQKKANDLQAYHTGLLAAQVAKSQPSAAEQLTTTQKDGLTYLLRGGKWYHIPSANPLMDTVTETTPAQDAVPGVPEKPASGMLWWKTPAVPAIPGIPGHGKITRTRKVPSGLPMGTAAAALTAADNTDGESDQGDEEDSGDAAPAAAALTAQAAPGMALPQSQAIPRNNPLTGMPYNPLPPSAPTAPVKEVVRTTKDGKRSVFNADTKEFIRYAD